jgi:hypothetical protein
MREDNPATEVMNSLSACMNACGMLCLMPLEAQRDVILDAVAWFVEAAPFNELPTVRPFGISRETIRNGAAVAARIQPVVLAWDGTTEPPLPLVNLAREFLVSVGMGHLAIPGAAPGTPSLPT